MKRINILPGIFVFIICQFISVNIFAQCNNVTAGGTIVSDQTVCGSYNPANITNSVYPTGGTGTLQYQWQSSPNNTTWTNISGATLESYDPSTISATTYYHRLARRSGCITYDGSSNTVTKTVNPLPTATITAGGPITFCGPGSVVLTANSVAGTTYQWKKNGAAIAGATLQTYTATTTGNYTVTKTITATGCSATSLTTIVTVHASLTTTITAPGFQVCGASTVNMEVQSAPGYSYQWYEGSNLLPNTNNYQLTTGHNGNYSCTITNLCGSYPSAVYPLNNSQLNLLPYGVIYASGSTTICTGQSVYLYEGFQFFSGYQWYKNGSAIGGANSSSYTATQAGNYGVLITDLCPMGGTISFYSNWITVISSGSTLPVPSVTAGGPTTFCSGGSVLLTEATGAGWTYQWRNNNSNISGATNPTYSATATGSYTCAVYNTCGVAVSSAIAVAVQPNVVTISGPGQTNICSGSSAILTATTAGSGGTYQWKLNGTNISGATASTYAATAQGAYTCSITNSCGTFNSNSISITVSGTCSTGLIFDGSNDYVKVPNNAAYGIGTGNFTIEAWINLSSTVSATYPVVLSHRLATSGFSGFMVYFSGGKLTIQMNGVNRPAYGADLRDNLCHHIAITRSSTAAINFYIDGVLAGTSTSANYNITTTDFMIIGNDAADNFSDGFKGKIMEVRFWNLARTQTQLQSTMNTLLAGNETGLISYWRLNDGTGQVANDFSTINNDGQLGSTTGTDTNDPVFGAACAICAPPTATITAGGSTTFCSGSSVVLSANTGTGLTYQWKVGTSTLVGSTNATYTASSAGSYTCVVTNSCGTTTSNAIVVIVNTLPTASITAAGATTFCSGGNVVLNATTGTGWTYQWKKNGSSIAGATSSSYTATTAGSYTCAVTNTCGTSTSAAIAVTVNSVPTATISSPTTVLCTGASIVITANSGTGLTYQWKLNGVNISGATLISYTATGAGSYTCLVSNACGGTTSNTIVITALAVPATPGTITGQSTNLCGGVTVSYSITAVANATTYTWTVPSGATINSGQGTVGISVHYPTVFISGIVTVTAGNSCGTSATKSLAVKGAPSAPSSITGTATPCANQTYAYSATAVSGATSYTWTVPTGATVVTGQGTVSVTIHFGTSSGSVKVKALNSCGTGSNRSKTVTISCREGIDFNTSLAVVAYPNPSQTAFTFEINNSENSTYDLTITDLTGRVIETHNRLRSDEAYSCGENLATGLYIAIINTSTEQKIIRLIKE
ncbi:MAG: T9SS type A sorting domain-containing protein [Bacteroidetes bacterium]|nr:T9SS type A sorting domain-containing protein [Bacteroidota bacterium]